MRYVLLVLALAVPVSAQTVESTIDLAALGWGPVEIPAKINTDRDTTTQEWLVRSVTTRMYRVVALRDGGLCVGDWFFPTIGWTVETKMTPDPATFETLDLFGVMRTVKIDTPVCQ